MVDLNLLTAVHVQQALATLEQHAKAAPEVPVEHGFEVAGRNCSPRELVSTAVAMAFGGIPDSHEVPLDHPTAIAHLVRLGFAVAESTTPDRTETDVTDSTQDPVQVKAAWERMYPDPDQRLAVARLVADSLAIAHSANPAGWLTSLRSSSKINITYGRLIAIWLAPGRISMSCDEKALSEGEREQLSNVASREDTNFRTAPGFVAYRFTAEAVESVRDILLRAQRPFIEKAQRDVRQTPYAYGHTRAIPTYLSELLRTTVQQPIYALASPLRATPEHETALRSVAGTAGRRDPMTTDYDALLRSLREKGLHFTPELVSEYIVALQTKRFVILTGISGTGKTQLAMAVAKHFNARSNAVRRRKASDIPHDCLRVTVSPYMRKYGRFVIPAQLSTKLFELQPDATSLSLETPNGTWDLRVSRETSRNVTTLYLRGEAFTWFETQLQIEDEFLLRVSAEGIEPRRLQLTLPEYTTEDSSASRFAVIAVQPDWTDRRGLLGYYSPITRKYDPPPFLRLLMNAEQEMRAAEREHRAAAPFFLILDEMNLARVEHYFADFLSAMESDENIDLHAVDFPVNDVDACEVPTSLRIPSNVFFTGTVNVDETTHMFSSKVLDRAFVLELDDVHLEGYGSPVFTAGISPFTLGDLTSLTFERRPSLEDWLHLDELPGGSGVKRFLLGLHKALKSEHRHFGFRVANEVARFLALFVEQTASGPDLLWTALDLAIHSKILPKFHGTQQELQATLTELRNFCVQRNTEETSGLVPGRQGDEPSPMETRSSPRLQRTIAKLERMSRRLTSHGFASFIE